MKKQRNLQGLEAVDKTRALYCWPRCPGYLQHVFLLPVFADGLFHPRSNAAIFRYGRVSASLNMCGKQNVRSPAVGAMRKKPGCLQPLPASLPMLQPLPAVCTRGLSLTCWKVVSFLIFRWLAQSLLKGLSSEACGVSVGRGGRRAQ